MCVHACVHACSEDLEFGKMCKMWLTASTCSLQINASDFVFLRPDIKLTNFNFYCMTSLWPLSMLLAQVFSDSIHSSGNPPFQED